MKRTKAFEMSDAEFARLLQHMKCFEVSGCAGVAEARRQLLLSRLHEVVEQELGMRH